MNRTRLCLSTLAVSALAVSLVSAQPATKDGKAQPTKPADHAMPTPPPGMSEADMKACMEAATPGPMHEHLARGVGAWKGKCTSYCMGPSPVNSECDTTITAMMDNRFVKVETKGEMPGMGMFTGFAVCGYDNVSKKFQQTWVDNMGTGMMISTGELSADGKTMTWNYTYSCPVKKGPITGRIVENYTGKDTMTMAMYGPNPADGKEMKMMEIAYTRAPGKTGAPAPASSAK